MRQAYIKVPFDVEIREVSKPTPEANQVLVKIEACGVCGTDVHNATFRHTEKRAFGHEVVGIVEQCGNAVSNVKVGGRVVVENNTYCGLCEHCKNGDVIRCENRFGFCAGFADYALVDKRSLYPADGFPVMEAVLAEPLTVALDLVTTATIKFNQDVVIYGPGTIGLMAVKVCRLQGARRIFLVGTGADEPRVELARELGADSFINVDREDPVKTILGLTDGKGVARVLSTAPPKVLPGALEVAEYGGIVAFIGIAEEGVAEIDLNKFHFRKLQLRASFALPNLYFPLALQLIKQKAITSEQFVTHEFGLDDIEKALHFVANRKDNVIKAVIVP